MQVKMMRLPLIVAGWMAAVFGCVAPLHQAHAQSMVAQKVEPNTVVTQHISTVGGQIARVEAAVVDGTTAYLGEASDLVILDVRDTAAPSQRARLALPAPATDIQIVNGVAYVATQNGTLVIADVRNAAAPTLLGSYSPPALQDETRREATSVHVAGTSAFITYAIEIFGSYRSEVQIVNISNPAAVKQQSAFSPGPKIARDVFVANNLAYVLFASSSAGGLAIYDVRTPTKPVLRGTLPMQAAKQIFVANDRAYITVYPNGVRPGGLQIVDVRNATTPAVIGHYTTDAESVHVIDGLAYLGGSNGLQVVDIRNPSAITARSQIATSGAATRVFIGGGHAFVSTHGGLHVFDVHEPTHLRLCNMNITRRVLDAQIAGTIAYLFDVAAEPALQIVDLHDPARPVLRGRLPVPFVVESIAINNGIAYVAAGTDGIQILDVHNPDQPAMVSAVDTPGYAYGVHVHAGLAYVADGDAGLQIVNVTAPAAPRVVGALDVAGVATDVDVAGSVAYVGTIGYVDAPPSDNGVHVIDVAAPRKPRLHATYSPLPAQSVDVVDDLVYVGAGGSGVAILNVSDSVHPTLHSTKHDAAAIDIAAADGVVYAALGAGGVQVLDFNNPSAPLVQATIDTSGYAQSVAAAGNMLLIADDDGGLQVWQVQTKDGALRVYIPLAGS